MWIQTGLHSKQGGIKMNDMVQTKCRYCEKPIDVTQPHGLELVDDGKSEGLVVERYHDTCLLDFWNQEAPRRVLGEDI